MDDASFGLSESLRVLHQAGIRHVLPWKAPERLDPSSFSPDWANILSKLPPTPRVILTYQELGSDLTGAGNQERSALWRRLFALLGLPKGSLGFLPYSFDDGPSSLVHVETFLRNVSSISPALVLVFDSREGNPLFDGPTLSQLPHSNTTQYRRYPGPDALIRMDEAQFKAFAASLLTDIKSSLA